jgi:hypothetical protein
MKNSRDGKSYSTNLAFTPPEYLKTGKCATNTHKPLYYLPPDFFMCILLYKYWVTSTHSQCHTHTPVPYEYTTHTPGQILCHVHTHSMSHTPAPYEYTTHTLSLPTLHSNIQTSSMSLGTTQMASYQVCQHLLMIWSFYYSPNLLTIAILQLLCVLQAE